MPSPPSLLAALRAGTRALHERSEAAFVLAEPDVTLGEYRMVLARLLAFHAPLEAALAAWGAALAPYGLDLAARRRAPLLRRDLAALGEPPNDPPNGPPGEVPHEAAGGAPVVLPTAARALGALYVAEGATLGGQVLRRRLAPRLGLSPERGLAHLAAYGDAVGPMWRAFGDALARFDAALAPADRPAAHADAVAGAQDAFAAFETQVVQPTARRPAARPAALA